MQYPSFHSWPGCSHLLFCRNAPEESLSSEDDDDDDAISVLANSEIREPLTETEKEMILKSDFRAQVVEPHRILCKKCQKWINLGSKRQFAHLSNWFVHQMWCHHSMYYSPTLVVIAS